MNFMGMGILELGVIFLVAFLVLGPSRSIEMARTAGKVIRDLRRSMADMTAAIDLEELESSGARTSGTEALREKDPEKDPDNKAEDA